VFQITDRPNARAYARAMQTQAAGSSTAGARGYGKESRRRRAAPASIARRSPLRSTRAAKFPEGVDLTGARLSHYRVIELIGEGGSGRVYRALDTHVARYVAIKVAKDSSNAFPCRLRLEAQALSRVNDSRIARFYEFLICGRREFIVMEFVPGATLADLLKAGPLPVGEVIRLGSHMLRGLTAAHAARVLHCDIKPGNLKVTSSGELKILDFGLAKFLPDGDKPVSDVTGFHLFGTPPYTAPERWLGEAVDQRADIFSAGAVLYEMATGRRAFPQADLPHLVATILFEERPTASTVHPSVPEALSRVIARMLERDPGQRHPCASVAVDELDALDRIYKRRALPNHDPGVVSADRQRWGASLEGASGKESLGVSEFAV
jgi:serine/threonine protein kinase